MRARLSIGVAAAFVLFTSAVAGAVTITAPVTVSGASPFAACTGMDPGPGTVLPDTEVEPHVAVNPTNPDNVVGTWQQDRWSSGGAVGSAVGVSNDGGDTWTTVVVPKLTVCSGGTVFTRASDPWLSFSPDGTLYQMSLVVSKLPNGLNTPSGMSVSRSTDGGFTWTDPIFVANDSGGTVFHDKNTLTADPGNSHYAYAIWDQLKSPQGTGSLKSAENSSGFSGPTVFTRTTDGGVSWEQVRPIFNVGTHDQTIGNQIVVLPNGTLVNLFDLIRSNNKGKIRGFNVAVIRSSNKGLTWDPAATIVSSLQYVDVRNPDTGAAIRTADIIPEVAVDRVGGALYAVWQDGRFDDGTAHVAFSTSTDGGLTWSAPIQIDATPDGTHAFNPMVAVASDGTVGVSYYDFRHNTPAVGLPVDVWFTSCDAACTNPANWTETRVTQASGNMENAPESRGSFIGDYTGLAPVGTAFQLLLSLPGTTADSADVVSVRVTP